MKKSIWVIGIIALLVIGSISYFIGFKNGKTSFEDTGLIIQNKNISYHQYFDDYYKIAYKNDGNGILFQIQNPCLSIEQVLGESMKPYYNNETIIFVDTCFPVEKLEVGDVILFYFDWNMTSKLHHRIVEIDYKKRLIKTQGDNLEGTDNFISFDRVYGKEIGVLNILDDKKIVTEQINISEDKIQYCVCSSNSLLKVCHTNKEELMTDNFVMNNNLKEENCQYK